MSDKIKFIEINYHYHGEFTIPGEVISKHRPSNLFASPLSANADIVLVKHINYNGSYREQGINYQFFRGKNKFTHIPLATHRFVKKENPGMVLVQGLIFPLQVIALRMKLGGHCRIVLQHQGEVPFGRKKIFQKLADRCVNAYFFTSNGNAEEWISAGIIKDRSKCFEVPDASTGFSKKDKEAARQRTGINGGPIFLWVGRLNENKDPLTVLSGFEKYFLQQPGARLYMIYSEEDMLELVKKRIAGSPVLTDKVTLVGKIAHELLPDWYSGADYFVSGSRREGGGYALKEAMACGCIPVVTDIPAFMKTIDNGRAGYYFKAGDCDSLYEVLSGLDEGKKMEMSMKVIEHFENNLSPHIIAEKILSVYKALR